MRPKNLLETHKREEASLIIETAPFVDPATFGTSLLAARAEAAQASIPCGEIRGGVVNHHVLASDLLARFFAELARCAPDTKRIIILSPDHYQIGTTPVSTLSASYRVQDGMIQTDEGALHRLHERVSSAVILNAAATHEHGIAALVPFLAAFSPEVRIVPVLISQRIPLQDAEAVAAWIQDEQQSGETIVVVSSDMSHYLHEHEARKYDQKTLLALEEGDRAFFWRATDAFTDNGRSLWIVHAAWEDRVSFRRLGEGISNRYKGSDANTTTYLTGVWERAK